jgi:hypothetical protein
MKNMLQRLFITLVMLSTLNSQLSTLHAQGTAFTYQGRLNASGALANGSYDLTFTLFATNTSGVAIAGPVTNTAVGVTNGLFTTLVDFGSGAFTGTSNWLAIAVSTNAANSFSTLAPRQQVTPTPYALVAESANSLPGLVVQQNGASAPSLIGGSAENAIVSGVPGATIDGGTNNSIGGGSPYAYLGGGANNTIQAYSDHAFLGGGGNNVIQGNATYQNFYSTLVGGYNNGIWLGAFYSFLGGGIGNTIQYNSYYSVLGGGNLNSIQANAGYSVLGGGSQNSIQTYAANSFLGGGFNNNIQANATFGFLGGGDNNNVSGAYSTLGGGYFNQVTGQYATVPGGANNLAGGNYSFAAGEQAQATNNGAFVWADAEGTPFGSTTANQFSVRANGGVVFVTGGAGMTLDGQPVIAGSIVLTNNEPSVSLGSLTLSGGLSLPAPAGISSGGSPLLSADGNDNTYFGISAGQTGNNNTGIGYEALYVVAGFASGSNNTAVGMSALALNNGSDNTANGYSAMFGSGGSYNTANGYNAMNSNGGSGNTADGYDALIYNHGSYNTANGYEALGGSSLLFAPTGGNNTADGAYALLHNSSGSNNVANGANALSANTTGSENTALGVAALGNCTSDSGSVAIGYQALQSDNAGNNPNSFSGNGENTAVGFQAGQDDNSGYGNTTLGYKALQQDNSGYENTAIGDGALGAVTSGNYNTAVGYNAGLGITGNNNIDIGSFGQASDNGVIRIGAPGTQTSTYLAGNVILNGGLNIDETGTYGSNNGSVSSSALTFGNGTHGSGEGIASQRTSGLNQFDLALYTGFNPRLTVLASGNVGIGTTAPVAQLDVTDSTGSGTAVQGISSTGTSVTGNSVSGTGVQASSATGAALNIASGALKVQGAGVNTATTAFIQVETAANVYTFNEGFGDANIGTYINNSICDGNSNAVLIVTHNITASTSTAGKAFGDPVGVSYDPSSSHWVLFDQNTSGNVSMPLGTAFNVLVIIP